MSEQPVGTVVHVAHQAVGDIPDYHEWVYARMVKVDRRGRPNPRMHFADWQLWRCNNTDCPAQAFVPNELIRALLDAPWRQR